MTATGIGSLRHRLQIESPTLADDGAGGSQRVWTVVDTVWGAIRPLQGRERVVSDKLAASVTHEIEIRHRTDLTSRMRFVLGQRVFFVRSFFDPGERRARLICKCEERDL